MTDEVLDLYRALAEGGVGLIITGDFSAVPAGLLDETVATGAEFSYEDVRIEGFAHLPRTVHAASPGCKIVAQISGDVHGVAPSAISSPYTTERPRPLSQAEIRTIAGCFVETIAGLQAEGFDGVQLHAAHGGLLSRFLSPHSNQRQDEYGGSASNRARIVREIVAGARERVGDFPLLIKMNGTDYLPGGIDSDSFPALAGEMERAGFDAIEVSGGMWDCLVRSEEELGFRPVPSFLRYAERLDLSIPVILVGGNRDVERLEEIVRQGKADFVAMCRPFISEPDLPKRWLAGKGGSGTDCISCNGCLYDMWTSLERGEDWTANCLFKGDRPRVRDAQRWLSTWVEENRLT